MSVYTELTKDFSVGEWYDISNPPYLAGEICSDIELGEIRPQPRLRAVAALHTLITCNGSVLTPSGLKGNIATICMSASSSGKDHSNQYLKKATIAAGAGSSVLARIASAKDISRALMLTGGNTTLLLDECHAIMGNISGSKRGADYMSELGPEILSTYTDRLKKFSALDIENAKEKYEKEEKKLLKQSKDMGLTNGELERRKERLYSEIVSSYEDGIKDPMLNIMAQSTPENIGSFICRENIDSGLAGRFLFFIGTYDIPAKVRTEEEAAKHQNPSHDIIGRLALIKNSPFSEIKYADQQAIELVRLLGSKFEDHRNDPGISQVVSRAYERMQKVATALAIGNKGIIDQSILMWSYLFICDSIQCVESTLEANERGSERGGVARWEEIKGRIMQALTGKTRETGMQQSQLIQRICKAKAISEITSAISATARIKKSDAESMITEPVIMSLMRCGAIDSVGRKYWVSDAKKFDESIPDQKFIYTIESALQNMRQHRGFK